MKILILCGLLKNFKKDRASFRIRYLTALEMAKKGHDVTFIYTETGFRYTTKFVPIPDTDRALRVIGTPGILPEKFRVGGFAIIDCMSKILFVLTHSVDFIHVNSGHRPSSFMTCLIAKFIKNSVIIDECWEWLGQGGYAESRRGALGKFVSFYDRVCELRLKRLFDRIIVITTALKDRFKNSKKVIVLHGGAENSNLQAYDIEEARDHLDQPEDWQIIGMSNLTRGDHKDNQIFFKAFKKLCNHLPNVYLMATSTDADYINSIESHYQLVGRIIFPGYVKFETYNMYLSACNIFVLPFTDTVINRGRWPNKIGDYLCLKRPIITNPTGDIKEIFESYQVGTLCDETAESFYFVLKNFFENNKAIDYSPSDAAYLINDMLSFEKRVNKILEIFSTVAKEKIVHGN